MNGTATCRSCEETLPLSKFEAIKKSGRRPYIYKVCRACRTNARNKTCNDSPVMYIRRAHSQLQYSRVKRDPNTPWTITPDHLVDLYYAQSKRCALSGIVMTWMRDGSGRKHPHNISIDRIDPRHGYIEGNIQLVCTAVNMMKGSWSDRTFITICEQVAQHMGSASGQRKRAESFDSDCDDTETGWRPSLTD